jgi:hypothetical protein
MAWKIPLGILFLATSWLTSKNLGNCADYPKKRVISKIFYPSFAFLNARMTP